jgi:hypothetical protein
MVSIVACFCELILFANQRLSSVSDRVASSEEELHKFLRTIISITEPQAVKRR